MLPDADVLAPSARIRSEAGVCVPCSDELRALSTRGSVGHSTRAIMINMSPLGSHLTVASDPQEQRGACRHLSAYAAARVALSMGRTIAAAPVRGQ